MAIVIAKNTTPGNIMIEDLGIEVPTGGQTVLTDFFSFDEILDSPNLQSFVSAGNLTINNGDSDLSISNGLDYITVETVLHDPNDPIFNANKIQYISVPPAPPLDGQALRYRATNGGTALENAITQRMLSNAGPGGIAAESNVYIGDPIFGAFNSFDGWTSFNDDEGRWSQSAIRVDGSSAWISYEFDGDPEWIISYSIWPPGNFGGYNATTRSPGTWTFEGWNVKTESWDILDTQTGITGYAAATEMGPFTVTNPGYYQKYRLNVTHGANGNTVSVNDYTSIGELQLFRNPVGQYELEDLSLPEVPPPDGWDGYMVMPLYWSKPVVNKGDWINVSGITDSTAAHQFPFPVKIRDTLGWCKRCKINGIDIDMYLDDTNVGTYFSFVVNSQPQTLFQNELDVIIPAGTRVRLRASNTSGNPNLSNLLINIVVERVG